jgi:hypothetical protein
MTKPSLPKAVCMTPSRPASAATPARRRSSRKGVAFAFPGLNETYAAAKALHHRLGGGLPCLTERVGDADTLTWAQQVRLEVPVSGGDWRIWVRDLDSMAWHPADPSFFVHGMARCGLPELQLLPISPHSGHGSVASATRFIERSFRPILKKAGVPFGDDVEQVRTKDIEAARTPDRAALYSSMDAAKKTRGSGRIPERYLNYASPTDSSAQNDWDACRYRMLEIFHSTIAGRVEKKGQKAMPGTQAAFRGFVRQFWKLVDRDFLKLVATVFWREPVTLSAFLALASQKTLVTQIGKTYRNRLPLLSWLPVDQWACLLEETPASPLVLTAHSSMGSFSGVCLDETLTRHILDFPVSLKRACLLSPHAGDVLRWFEHCKNSGIPDWVWARFVDREVRATASTRHAVITESLCTPWTPERLSEWTEAVQTVLAQYRARGEMKTMQKKDHHFWEFFRESFTCHRCARWDCRPWAEGEGFFSRMPQDWTWTLDIEKTHLERQVAQAAILSSAPRQRRL